MERVGIPVFESRVSPVLDSCHRMVVVDIKGGFEIQRQEISLEKLPLNQRLELFTRWGIRKIICAGVSDLMCRFLSGIDVVLISGVAGDIEKIIKAYICNRLDDTCFSMPGKKSDKSKGEP
jgi:predicted Fe-Mo cluster-binding NifX family protein